MSPLLAIALVLLVLVVGLTLLQRRARETPSSGPGDVQPPAPPSPPARSTPARPLELRTDPLLGDMSFDGDMWMVEEDLTFGEVEVLVEISGTIDGPTDADRAFVTAAMERPDLHERATALVLPELARRGIDATGMTVYELAVGPDDDGVLCGYLWYNVPDFMAEIGVKSTDHWRTLRLEVVE